MSYKFRGKNYLFASSLPGRVTVPELGATYANINQAAESLGISVQAIARVLTGQQKTAGGYHFKPYKAPAGEGRRKKEDKRKKQLDKIKQQIKESNDIIKEARERKREGFLENVSELDDFGTDVIGSTGDNFIDDASDVLDDMDEDELKQLEEKLDDLLKKARDDMQKAEDRLKEYADVFGVSSHDMEKYEPMIPEINRVLDRAKEFGIGSDVFEEIRNLIMDNVDPRALRDFLNKCNDFFNNPGEYKRWTDALKNWEFKRYNGASWEELYGDDDDGFNY